VDEVSRALANLVQQGGVTKQHAADGRVCYRVAPRRPRPVSGLQEPEA